MEDTSTSATKDLSNKITSKQLNNTLRAIHLAYTRSNHAMWASATLIFLCVLIALAVCYSGMWKEEHQAEWNKSPYINFNEKVPFKDVLKHKLNLLRQFKKLRKKKNKDVDPTEMEQLLL